MGMALSKFELLKYIQKEVNLLPEDIQMSMLAIPFQNVIKKGQFSIAWGRYQGKKKAIKYEQENQNGKESIVKKVNELQKELKDLDKEKAGILFPPFKVEIKLSGTNFNFITCIFANVNHASI